MLFETATTLNLENGCWSDSASVYAGFTACQAWHHTRTPVILCGGQPDPPGGHVAMSGDIFVVTTGGGVLLSSPGGAQGWCLMPYKAQDSPPPPKNYLDQYIKSAQGDRPSSTCVVPNFTSPMARGCRKIRGGNGASGPGQGPEEPGRASW